MDITLLKALADPTRLKLIELLLTHSYCVRALSTLLDMSESAISQHLKILREAELVEGVKYGYYTHYRVRREQLDTLKAQLDALIQTPHNAQRNGCIAAHTVGCRRTQDKGGSSPC